MKVSRYLEKKEGWKEGQELLKEALEESIAEGYYGRGDVLNQLVS